MRSLLFPILSTFFVLGFPSHEAARVTLGNEILRDEQLASLGDRRLAILSNPTGVFQDSLRHIVDEFNENPTVDVAAVLSPEHGFRGDHQAETGDPILYQDYLTGLPVISAYKLSAQELSLALHEMDVDTILVDMQDVGVRLYTFIWTMWTTMQASSLGENPLDFIVTDRPNPLGGELVDGPLINMSCCSSGYGRLPITHIHGMTIGELALFFNTFLERPLTGLNVVKMKGWERHMHWDQTGLEWVPPSPNIPSPLISRAYGASVFLEATTIAEGRGTTTPFLLFGAPFIDIIGFASSLNPASNNASMTRQAYFNPTFSKYNGTDCSGVQWVRGVEPHFRTAVHILVASKANSPSGDFAWDGSWFGHPGTELIDSYAGTPDLRNMIDSNATVEEIVTYFKPQADQFSETRRPFLIY